MGTQLVPPHIDEAISALADQQWGVVARRQLLAFTPSPNAIHHRLATGRLRALHRGVYAVGHTRLRIEGFWMAAVLAGGPGAVLGYASAGALWELRSSAATRIDIILPIRGTRAITRGIRWHTSRDLPPTDTTTHRGIPTTTPARTILDLADVLAPRELEKTRDRAQNLHLDAYVEPRRGRKGTPTLDAVKHHKAGTTITKSELEEMFLQFLKDEGLPIPVANAHVEGRERDWVWFEQRVIAELDSREHHLSIEAFEEDRARDAETTVAGWRTIRITHRRLTTDRSLLREQLDRLLG